ncbi:MAG: actin-binding protein [Bdellovibrionaceae bacterium]|nr:actin-binding protein [Pseudobdellovibrionaceae bacterium]
MATSALQKFLNQLSKNKNVQNVVNEFTKIGDEIKKRSTELNQRWTEEKDKTLHQAQDKYHQILKAVNSTQSQLDKEVTKAIEKIRASATEVEKNLDYYRKKAVEQKDRVEKILKSKKKAAAKTTKKTAKKVAKKTVKKTSKKS